MTDRTGQQLGNYLLTRPLGRGGFAEVYLGQHIYLKTQAAIKVLQTQLEGEDMDGFIKEAQTIAKLVHPNIVRVLEFGVEGQTPYLVMDYAPNGTLRQRHPRGSRLEPEEIVPYIKQIAAGLQYAHDQKLIHRDVKPENLLVGAHGDILLSDFGIALAAQSSRYQSTQDVVGTVAYMSPEQIQGRPRPASDLYSLGIVVYEWLTGDRPFRGSFTELCTQHMFAPPPPLRERMPSISPEIEQVVNTALAKDYKQRFGSVQAFANALEQASRTQPTLLKRPLSQPISSSLPPSQPISSPSAPSQPIRSTYPSPQPVSSTYPSSRPDIPPPPPFTSATIPPPPPPPSSQQLANLASMPYGYNNPYNYNAMVAQPTTNEKVNPWRVGVRQVIGTVIGAALFTLAWFALDKASNQNFNPSTGLSHLFDPIISSLNNSFSGYFTWGNILFSLAYTIPLFFTIEFGPWAGIIGAVAGNLLGDYFAFQMLPSPWYYYIGNPLLVIIPAIALAFLASRTGRINKITIILALTALGIVVSSLLEAIADSIKFPSPPGFWLGEFAGYCLDGVICLIALPIILSFYHAVVGSKRSI